MKVSIVTATLNTGKALATAIDSVVSQSYPNIELIIVDGASADGETLDIIKRYHERYPNLIRWTSEPDGGVYHALNKGIAMATGDIIGLLHGNDYLVNGTVIERVLSEFEAHPETPYVYGDVHFFAPSGRCVRLYSGSGDIRFNLRHGIAPPHPSLYMRRSAVEQMGGYREDYEVAADFEYFVRMALVKGMIGRYIPLDMVAMSLGGLSTRLRSRLLTNNLEKMRALRQNGISRVGLGVITRYIFTPFQ